MLSQHVSFLVPKQLSLANSSWKLSSTTAQVVIVLLVCRQYFSRVSNLGLKNGCSCLQSCSWFNSLKALPRFSQSSLSCFSLYGTENGLNLSFKNPFSLFLFFCFSGTMTFGEQNSLSQSFGLLSLAFHSGINFFDSAEMYVSFPLLLFLLGFLNLIWCHFWLIFEPRYPVPQRAETQGKSEEYIGRWIRETKIPVIALSWRQRFIFTFSLYYLFPDPLRYELSAFQGFTIWLIVGI